jgi:predicted dehydrogenase
MAEERVRVAIIGVGGMGRHHIRQIAKQQDTTVIPVVCDIAPASYEKACQVFREGGLEPPPNEPDLHRLLAGYKDKLDAAFIVTPHACHYEQTVACMEAGLDVLLEKPMVMNGDEARRLIAARDRTGKLLVVAFPGSLSPQIRTATRMIHSGEIGDLLSISGVVWQNWGPNTSGTWRQQIEVSGGGFLFDTGAHLLNTVTDLAGQDFVEVAAWLDNHNRPVDILGTVMGKLKSGAFVTLHGCGEAIKSCNSDVRVFCSNAILRTGVWGECLDIQRQGRKRLTPIKMPASLGVWQQFLAVRAGTLANPCPPEVGLRMARLWDAIRESSAKGGQPVQCK